MKTTNEVLTDMYDIITTLWTGKGLSGSIYKKTRPSDSKLEDTIIHLIAGNNAKFVTDGALYVKIFYADINQLNTYFEDSVRGQYMENLLITLSEALVNTTGYFFHIESRETYTEKVEEYSGEHYAILKMNFQILN